MADFDRGAVLVTLFEARRYDLASKADRKLMAALINEALEVTETAARERCAKHVDLIAADWREARRRSKGLGL